MTTAVNGASRRRRLQHQPWPLSLMHVSLQRYFGIRSLLSLLVFCYVVNHVAVFEELSSMDRTNTQNSRLPRPLLDVSKPLPPAFATTNTINHRIDKDGGQQTPTISSQLPYVSYDNTSFEDIRAAMDAGNDTAAQFLLDFGIIGFPKCGTTTMMQWLGMHKEIAAIQREIMALQRQHPARLVNFVLKELPAGRFLRGYKSPNDVEDQRALNKLAQHYPHTKLIVGIRHPILWYESFYNHRVQNGFDMPPMMDMNQNCNGGYHGVCISRAGYHANLVRMGKTLLGYDNSTNYAKRETEWNVFSTKEQRSLKNDLPVNMVSPNPVFLYDTSQLKMPSSTDAGAKEQDNDDYDLFVNSLKSYLGVSHDFPPMIQSKPGKKDLDGIEQAKRNALKVNICDDSYQEHRKWLLESGKRTKEWILGYFVQSPDVFVGNLEQFERILQDYDVDPCMQRNPMEG